MLYFNVISQTVTLLRNTIFDGSVKTWLLDNPQEGTGIKPNTHPFSSVK